MLHRYESLKSEMDQLYWGLGWRHLFELGPARMQSYPYTPWYPGLVDNCMYGFSQSNQTPQTKSREVCMGSAYICSFLLLWRATAPHYPFLFIFCWLQDSILSSASSLPGYTVVDARCYGLCITCFINSSLCMLIYLRLGCWQCQPPLRQSLYTCAALHRKCNAMIFWSMDH